MDFAKTIPAERTAAQRLCLSPAVQLDTAQRRELLLLRVHHLGERAGMAREEAEREKYERAKFHH
jgi:uncharacterized small protein (DUF1192 family)